MDIDFYTRFININFDEKLMENNNPLVSSQDIYLNYKNDYINTSLNNFNEYKKYKQLFSELNNTHIINNNNNLSNRYVFVYKNTKLIEETKQKIKNIIIDQEKLLQNFEHYIDLLNENPHMFGAKKQNEKRSFLSKLFDKKN